MRRAAAVLAGLLLVSGAAAEPVPEDSASVPVVMYHRFGEAEYPSTSIRLDQFEAHLKILADGGYTVLPLPEILDAMDRGDPLPDRAVAITIDDAYASVYREAWPRLKAAGLPFTLFVATDPVDRGSRFYMTWDQIRELAAAGVTIGNHSAGHPHMAGMAPDAAAAEIGRAAERFRAELGRAPDLFAYPFGEASRTLIETARRAGFRAAFGQHSGVVHAGADRYYLPRFALNEKYGELRRFRTVISALPLPVDDVVPADPLLTRNPPAFGFTVAEPVGDLDRLACYGSGQGRLAVERLGESRIEVRIARPFPPGRARVNCTLPEKGGRWRWFGMQFLVP